MKNKKLDKKKFWKSINEFQSPHALDEVKKNEFSERVTENFDLNELPSISRRKFLTLLSASTAFAAASCTDYHDKGEIIPYNNRPEEILPGKPDFYASACTGCENACGVLITTREGRPIKLDGNPEHPANRGKICAAGQASILNLYDPERLTDPMIRKRKSTWEIVDKNVIAELKKAVEAKKEIAVITHTITSPAMKDVINDFKAQYPTAAVYSYEEVDNSNRKKAWTESYGGNLMPAIDWEKADVILSVSGDFLGSEGAFIENIRKYSKRRDLVNGDNMNKLFVVEAGYSLTGLNADERISMKPEIQYEFLLSLAGDILAKISVKNFAPQALSLIKNYSLKSFASKYSLKFNKLNLIADELITNADKSFVYAGDILSKDAHYLVNLINEMLNGGKLYNYDEVFSDNNLTETNQFKELVKNLYANKVGVVINIAANPVFHLNTRCGLAEAITKADAVISLVESRNETSNVSGYELPINNMLESWGNHQVRNNAITLQQPVISPIFNTRQSEAVLLTWINGDPASYNENIYREYLKSSFKKSFYDGKGYGADFTSFWNSALHDGFVELKSAEVNRPEFRDKKITPPHKFDTEKFTLVLNRSYFIGDGRFANNGWLQEIPHPISKAAWDNYAAVSPATSKKLGIEDNRMISVKSGEIEIEIPVFVQSGLADNVISVELGYGRTIVGEVGKDAGFNADQFIGASGDISPWIIPEVEVSVTDKTYKIVTTQEHHSLDDEFLKDKHLKRDIIITGTYDEYKKNPEFLKRDEPAPEDLHRSHQYTENKWAMSIDLNKCISCAVCVSSCNVENNVPVVGKEQVAVGREMQWMRIDRYFSGTPDEPIPSAQPMLCQHCDNAPCENVCPVNATNHSPDGLNQMVYNRCVGTRYCLNNCPYKVRRFNFFNFRDNLHDGYYENELTALAHNPEVTVRSRGVMEKCSFCVQRIMEKREEAIRENRELNPNEIVTACQQSCPADAIVFGDSNNKESEIAKYREHNLAYHVLENLNVKPNVTYIAKLRNSHSEDA